MKYMDVCGIIPCNKGLTATVTALLWCLVFSGGTLFMDAITLFYNELVTPSYT